ncbi:acyl-CoA dehydrogenase family protein [Nocardioides sp.]|uniref:acyl-CoA dehydrogenase family protein n=1 Tax=Nocardioides sp. TaxID=35761 RepID=UPI00262FF708|nr:acyl-CoA dehydrogenase family protein [Nocardioides sp.]MDI6912484.1 acyl-CoA dehydrogenase family protein [Nocardioides sp.]
MTDESSLISLVTALLASRPLGNELEVSEWHANVWRQLEDTGLSLVGVPEEAGGQGGSIAEITTVVRLTGRHFARVPVAETAILAGWVLAEAGLSIPSGQLTVSLAGDPTFSLIGLGAERVISGSASRVPYATTAARVVVSARDEFGDLWVASLPAADLELTPGQNLAGEPRDGVSCVYLPVQHQDLARVPSHVLETAHLRGALARGAAMVGAAERALDLTLRYARERVQFGRPLGKFQAIQGLVAEQSGEVAAAAAALDTAVEAMLTGRDVEISVAAAKTRIGSAASRASAIAHQVHGALGMTDEHPLHLATLSMWSWRDEYGRDSEWAITLGRSVAEAGGAGVWPLLTSVPAPPDTPIEEIGEGDDKQPGGSPGSGSATPTQLSQEDEYQP